MARTPFRLSLLLLALVAGFGCGDSSSDRDPCSGVVCPRNHDCEVVKGKGLCVERSDEEEVECEADEDCTFHARGPICDTDLGRCISCFGDEDCAEGRSCDGGICRGEVCTFDRDCLDEDGVPLEEGKGRCAADGGACVACVANEDCSSGVCEAGVCTDGFRTCEEDAECKRRERCMGQVCVPVHCQEESDCAPYEGRSCFEGFCQVVCKQNADCVDDPAGPYCELSTGLCAACTSLQGCPPGTECTPDPEDVEGPATCEPVACEKGAEENPCSPGSICGDDGICKDVSSCSAQSKLCQDERRPFCDEDRGRCLECRDNGDCGKFQRCEEGICQQAQECFTDSNCAGDFVCIESACTACRDDAACPRGTCDEGTCENRGICESDADCAQGRCVDGSCAGCEGDLDCPFGQWCEAGRCEASETCGPARSCGVGEVCQGGACVPSTCADDDAEPDNRPAQARPLDFGMEVERVLCSNDEDWYTFRGTPGNGAAVRLEDLPEGARLSVVWYTPDEARRRVEQEAPLGHWVSRLQPAASGRYYIRVRSVADAAGPYKLKLEGTHPCDDVMEPNDRREDAVELPTGTYFDGLSLCRQGHDGPVDDVDFYLFDVPNQTTFTFFAFFLDGGGVNLSAFTEAGNNIPSNRILVTNGEGWSSLRVQKGTEPRVLIRVQPKAPRPSGYSLFAAAEEDAACGSGPALLTFGQREARVSGSVLGGTGGKATPCGSVMRWFPVTVGPDAARVVVEAQGSFGPALAWMGSNCAGGELCVAGQAGSSRLDLAEVAPGNYVIGVVVPDGTGRGDFELSVRLEEPMSPPDNAVCSAPEQVVLPGLSETVHLEGSTWGAMPSMQHGCGPMGPNVFYQVNLAAPGRLVADLQASMPMAVYLTNPACGAPTHCSDEGRLDVSGLAAGNYVVGVSSLAGYSDFELELTAPAPLPHNDCAQAQDLNLGTEVQGSTRWASNGLSYPLAESCTGYYTGGHDLFYRVQGLSAGQKVEIQVVPEDTYDAAVYVVGTCPAGASVPACLDGVDAEGPGGTERFTFTAPQAGNFWIVVDGAKGGGDFRLKATAVP